MTLVLLAALVVVIVAHLIADDRRDKRAREDRQADRLERTTHLSQIDALVAAHRREIAVLCQRIQAPEHAVVEHAVTQAPPDGDGYPLTDEQIAEEQDRLAAIKHIEELEHDFQNRVL